MNRSQLVFFLLGKKNGYDINKMIRFVNENQYWSKAKIEEYQVLQMQSIIKHAYEHTVYYSKILNERGLTPRDFKDLTDLKRLPILSKQEINNNWKELVSNNYKSFRPMHRVTSGTTGATFQYYNDSRSWGLNWATKMRTFGWGGYSFGEDKIATMKGGSMLRHSKTSFKSRFWMYLHNYLDFPVVHLSNENMELYYNQMKSKKIKYLRGYPSAVYTFAKFVKEMYGVLPLNATYTSAEYLQDYQRKQIEETFCTKHIDAYGCGDGMGGANQCEMGNEYHTNIETSILEVINKEGNDCITGEQGEIVLTSLHDYAMPMLRFTPGDVAVVGSESCSCGRTLPLLKRVVGRTSDLINLPNGRTLNGIAIPFEDWANKIEKFQIWHTAPDKIELKIIPKATFKKEDLKYVHKILAYHLGEGIHLRVDMVKDIPLQKNGKFKYVISKVK